MKIITEHSDRIKELYEKGLNYTDIGKQICLEQNCPYTDSHRTLISKYMKKQKFRETSDNPGLIKECEAAGIDFENVKHFWYKSKKYSINVQGEQGSKDINFEDIFSEVLSKYEEKPKKKINPLSPTFDRLVWSDVHVGMDASQNGTSLYELEWNKQILLDRVVEMAQYTLLNKKSDILYIDELGDFLDGWNGETTRGGHKLPQNMSNQEAFDIGLKAKMLLIDILQPHYDSICCNNICNDNHSGDFSYILNSAFSQIIDHKYDNVHVTNLKKFISWYTVGEHTIVLSHGKDSQHMKFGFKPQLDSRQIEKIDQFLKHNKIYSEGKYIEFSKGDSHQCLFDMCTSDDFHYFNFPAFSPSSSWVQHNFKKGRSGFVFMTYDYYGPNKIMQPYFFSN